MSSLYIRDDGTHGWSAVTAWSTGATIAAGALRRQLATPAVGSERVFVAIVAGTTHATTEPTWTVTKGAKTTDNTVTWQECTGQAAVNGDLTNTPLSSTVRSTNPGLGKIIKDNGGTHIFICSTAGACGAGEPTYTTAAVGNTTTDSSCTWTYIGASFSTWSAPHAKIQNAAASTWGAAGDDLYIADDHAQTQASALTLTFPGTIASPNNAYCIDHTASLPAGSADLRSDPYTTSSPACTQITTTGNNSITLTGTASVYGFVFNVGTGAVTATISLSSMIGKFERCSFRKLGTAASTAAVTMPDGEWVDCTVQFGATGDQMRSTSITRTRWVNSTASAILGATLPTTMILMSNSSLVTIDGVDFSALGSGKTLITVAFGSFATARLVNCKLGSSVTIAATPVNRSSRVEVISSDSGGATYRQELYLYDGTLTPETTIVRTGGATDGTTPLAWKIVTTANSKWAFPFEAYSTLIWNNVIGSPRTLTMYGIWGGGAPPNDDEIWIDSEYLSASGSPIGSGITSTKTNALTSASALSSDGSSWGGSTTAFKMSVSFTALIAGYVRVRVRAAKISSTFYIDPKPVLS